MFLIDDCHQTRYMIQFHSFGARNRIVATDLVHVWTEEMSCQDIMRRCQEFNPNIEEPPTKMMSRVIMLMYLLGQAERNDIPVSVGVWTDIRPDAQVKIDFTVSEKIYLNLETKLAGFAFRYKFELILADSIAFAQEVTIVLKMMIHELEKRVKYLSGLVEKKDKEIEQYKLEGAHICRKSVETEPFKKKEFEKLIMLENRETVKRSGFFTEEIIQLWKSLAATKIKDASPVKEETQINIKEEPASDDSDSRESSQLKRNNAAAMETHDDLQIKQENDSTVNYLNDGVKRKKVQKLKLPL